MNRIENFRSLARRTGYEKIPIQFSMCPSLTEKFKQYIQETAFTYEPGTVYAPALQPKFAPPENFMKFYSHGFKKGTTIDIYGVAHEPGSAAAFHMTKMYHPMEAFDSVEQILAYPLPDFSGTDLTALSTRVEELHAQDQVVVGGVGNALWEVAWYMRGMENLMVDMMTEDIMAEVLLDRVTEIAVDKIEQYARSGVDVIYLGDDIGMQHSIMMSEELYRTWLQPRHAKIFKAAKVINPNVIIIYHSCGYVTPLIPNLIEAGIDVLNPVQPECMDFREIHDMFGDQIAFNGTIGTQTTMPFGTPEDVRREVFKNLEIAGDKGGLFVAPTHMLEPEVPVENVIAYIKACQDF